MKRNRNNSLFDRTLLRQSLRASFQKLDPRKMVKNPIMFTVEAVTFVMLLLIVWIAVTGNTSQGSLLYNVVVFLVLLPRCSSPTSPRPLPRRAARRRPTRCARPVRKPLPSGSTRRTVAYREQFRPQAG